MTDEERLAKLVKRINSECYGPGDFPSVQQRLATLWKACLQREDWRMAKAFANAYLRGFQKAGFDVSQRLLEEILALLIEKAQNPADYHLQPDGELRKALNESRHAA